MAKVLESITNNLVLAFEALKENKNLIFASNIRVDAEQGMRRLESPIVGSIFNQCDHFLTNSSTALKIILGLGLALPMYIAIPATMIKLFNSASDTLQHNELISTNIEARSTNTPQIYVQDFREGTYLMILSFIAGSTGSIISILSRAADYNSSQFQDKYNCSFLPIFIGLFKPVIGGAFGILVFAAMNTTLFNSFLDQSRTEAKWFTVIAITFVTGFSERLAKDMIGQVEDSLANKNPSSNNNQISDRSHEVS